MPVVHNLNVLVVDDQPSMRGLTKVCLKRLGIDRITDAGTGREALDAMNKQRFDLVISDWRMPSMNGIAFLNQLVQIQPNIARLVLSAYGDFLSEVAAIRRINIFHFINKPWNNDELRSLMCQALEHRRAQMSGNNRPSDEELRDQYRLSEIELRRMDQEQPTIGQVKRQFAFQDRIGLCS